MADIETTPAGTERSDLQRSSCHGEALQSRHHLIVLSNGTVKDHSGDDGKGCQRRCG